MAKTQQLLIEEEQEELNYLISRMDRMILILKKSLTQRDIERARKKAKILPDAYGELLREKGRNEQIRGVTYNFVRGRDELYDTRMIVELTEENGRPVEEELHIGFHTLSYQGDLYIVSWTNPLCRHFVLDNAASECDQVVTDKYGRVYKSHISMKLRRKIELSFDKRIRGRNFNH